MFKSRTLLAAAICVLAPIASAQGFGDAENGENIFRKCKSCHQIGEGAKNRTGPVLTGVYGRHAASFDSYKYGKSMRAAGEADLVWTLDNLCDYLINPSDFLKTYLDDPKARAKMSFKLKDEQDRRDVVAYLKTFSDEEPDTSD